MPNGSKYFRLNYRFHGKRKTLPLGVYPELSLKEAREKRDIAKKQIAEGIDPMLRTKNHHFAALRFPDFQRWYVFLIKTI
jgi:hypothetical protein